MAKLRPEIEWAPKNPKTFRQYGMRERWDDKWEVLRRVSWWKDELQELEMVVDSRDAAIGFIKLLRGE
jgi:hypothetical protein